MTGTQLKSILSDFGVTSFTKSNFEQISTIQLKSNNSLYMSADFVWTLDTSLDLLFEYFLKSDGTTVLYAVHDVSTVFGVTGASSLHPHDIQMDGGIL